MHDSGHLVGVFPHHLCLTLTLTLTLTLWASSLTTCAGRAGARVMGQMGVTGTEGVAGADACDTDRWGAGNSEELMRWH